MKKNYWIPLILSLVFICGVFTGAYFNGGKHWANSFFGQSHQSMEGRQKLNQVLDLIEDNYVDNISIDSLVEMAIPSLLKNLDPHSAYIPAKDLREATSELEGKFSGIGISFQILNDTISVVEVISGGPAEKVGVMPGDRIIKVDDKELGSMEIKEDDVFSLLRGDKGTHVSITVKRMNARQPLTFEITRDDIPIESIDASYMIDGDIGYVKISRFARNTYDEVLSALNELKINGAKRYIIDLRYNGGGYMDPAVRIANEFLKNGSLIVSTKGKNDSLNEAIYSNGFGAFQDSDIVVVVNEFSASASEILTGAIQDNDRGLVVGRRTFGKGLVQSPVLLPDSSEIRLTVQRYYTPSGRCIQKQYTPGSNTAYELELAKRFNNGESFSADSIKFNEEDKYITEGGRTVYGGGGIMPDIFVPEDTSHITPYYLTLVNQSLPIKYAYEYCDLNRENLQKAKTVEELIKLLPADEILLNRFANYAAQNGVNKRPVYLDISRDLILTQLKALIARNMLGIPAYYQVYNRTDKTIKEAIKQINTIHNEIQEQK